MFEKNDPFKIEKSLKLLNINIEYKNKKLLLNEISKYLFGIKKSSSSLKEKNFDLNFDYKYYFSDFFELGIDLNHDEIDWWVFDSLLHKFMLKDDSTIAKVLSYRTYTKPPKSEKTREENRHKFMMKMKNKYSLPIIQNENGFEKMWGYLEKKVGENKE